MVKRKARRDREIVDVDLSRTKPERVESARKRSSGHVQAIITGALMDKPLPVGLVRSLKVNGNELCFSTSLGWVVSVVVNVDKETK